MDISLSKAVRSNLSSLQSTASMMAMTQNRLSTGNKVNSALDNPSNFFTASSLKARASDMNNLMDSMASGIKTIEAADNGLKAITKTLESMQSTLRQARQDKSFATGSYTAGDALKDKTAVQKISFTGGAVGSVAQEVDATKSRAVTTATTDFASLDLNSGTAPAFTAQNDFTFTIAANDDAATSVTVAATSDTNLRVTIGTKTYDTEIADSDVVTKENVAAALNKAFDAEKTGITVDGTGAKLKFTVNADKAVADADASITFGADNASLGIVKATDATSILTVAKTTDELVNDINANTDLNTAVRASNDNGKLRIENLSTQKLEIGGISSAGTIDGTSTGAAAASILGNSVRAGLADQFNELRDQLDKLSDDASFNGINLLRGDALKITFNEVDTSEITVQAKDGKTVNSANLGVQTTLEAKDLDADTSIDGFLAEVKSALNSVRSQASSFGSNLSVVQNRQDFTRNMIGTLEEGAGNLTLADTNLEAANLLALQTRQSLAQSSLSLASQADQAILQLLR